ncbi:MAG: aldo/keto reductase [Succinivibrionaceae bacterium]
MANGVLTVAYKDGNAFSHNDYRSVMPQFTPEAQEKNQELMALLQELAESKKVSPAAIVLSWILARKPYIVPIPGSRNIQRIASNLQGSEVILSSEDNNRLTQLLNNSRLSDVFGGSPVKKE